MANYMKLAAFRPTKFVTPSSRYHTATVIYYTEQQKVAFKIYKRNKQRFSKQDKWFGITEDVEYRPDLVSFEFYGTPDYWWKIMEMNGMKDVLEFKAGKNIKLPGIR